MMKSDEPVQSNYGTIRMRRSSGRRRKTESDGIRETFRGLGAELVAGTAGARDAVGKFDRTVWRQMAGAGMTGLHMPRRYGGRGWDPFRAVDAFEGFSEGSEDAGMMVALISQVGLVETVIRAFGTDRQKQRWLPGLIDGTLVGCFAVTERHGGSDVRRMSMKATAVGKGGWKLHGEKWCVTNAPVADVAVVFAEAASGGRAVTAFIADLRRPGVVVSAPFEHSGIRTAPAGSMAFEDYEMNGDALLGAAGQGHRILKMAFALERILSGVAVTGGLRAMTEKSVEWASSRRIAGTAIASHQHVQAHMVKMAASAELVRASSRAALRQWLAGDECSLLASTVKLTAAEAFLESAMATLRIQGNHGYTRGGMIERFCRDAPGILLAGGTAEIHRGIIWRELVRSCRTVRQVFPESPGPGLAAPGVSPLPEFRPPAVHPPI
jgi:alkylation response protein AidB-like acyl-CoA dehydrogenase